MAQYRVRNRRSTFQAENLLIEPGVFGAELSHKGRNSGGLVRRGREIPRESTTREADCYFGVDSGCPAYCGHEGARSREGGLEYILVRAIVCETVAAANTAIAVSRELWKNERMQNTYPESPLEKRMLLPRAPS